MATRSTLRPAQHQPREADYKIFQPRHRRETLRQSGFEKDTNAWSLRERTLQLCLDREIQKSRPSVQGGPQGLRAVSPKPDTEGDEVKPVGIEHLEAGTVVPRIKNIAAVGGLAGGRKRRLQNQGG